MDKYKLTPEQWDEMVTAQLRETKKTLEAGTVELIPFEIYDPFYSEKNQAELSRRISDIEAGKNLTPHELIEVEDE